MSQPVSSNKSNCIFLELPKGKIGKDGKPSVQKGQKGSTAAFYAMKMLLPWQPQGAHRQKCSLRRKAITAAGENFATPQAYYEARDKANKAFIQVLGKDPEAEKHAFFIGTLKQGMADVPAEFLEEIIDQTVKEVKNKLACRQSWYTLKNMDGAADQLMAEGYGLKQVVCKDLETIQKLMQTLRTKGPLMITGCFGSQFYAGQKPIKFAAKVEEHVLYGWKKGTSRSEGIGVPHAIVVIGAEIKNGKEYVYWVDPVDVSTPEEGRRVYFSSFKFVSEQMATSIGFSMNQMNQMSPKSKAIVVGALYNPNFSLE